MLRTSLKASSILSLIFVALYGAFVGLADWIHHFSPATDPAQVNRWVRVWLGESDGIETYAMLVGFSACLALGLLAVKQLDRLRWFNHPIAQVLCLAPALVIVGRVRSTNFTPFTDTTGNLVVAALALGVIAVGYGACRLTEARPWLGRGLLGVCWLLLGAAVLLAAQPPDLFDYGFFIGPALKLAAGEKLGSFYLQYNLLGTYLFRAMMALHLKSHQMQAALGVLFVFWMVLYQRLAARLIESRFVVFLFLACLLVVRFLAISGGPTVYPQVATIRMDLWVPLALVLLRFGPTAPLTAAAFSLCYLADNLFGFLFFALYGALLAGSLVQDWRQGRRPAISTLLGLAAPMLAVLAFELFTFGSLTNPAGKMYQSVHLGFLPISPTSMFWGIAWVLLLALFPIARDTQGDRRRTSLVLFGFAATQLLYFYGRSHDHNLLNLSGIWLLIVFVGLDRLRHHGFGARGPALAGVLFVCLSAVAVAQTAREKVLLARSRLARGVLLEPTAHDRELDRVPDLFAAFPRKDKVVLFSKYDAYLNYRYGLPQVGFFAPLYASVFVDSTAASLRELLGQGYSVVLCLSSPEDLLDLNASRTMAEAGQRFHLVPKGQGLFDVELVPAVR